MYTTAGKQPFLDVTPTCHDTNANQAGGAGGGRRLGLGEGLAPGVVVPDAPTPGGVGGRTVSPAADDAGEGSLGDAEEGPGTVAAAGTATEGLALGAAPVCWEQVVKEEELRGWTFVQKGDTLIG